MEEDENNSSRYSSSSRSSEELLRIWSSELSSVTDAEKVRENCRSLVEQLGATYIDKNGNTILHLFVLFVRDNGITSRNRALPVYVMAQNGVPLNHQNHVGDTPLHLAARYLHTYPDIFEAILLSGGDSEARNMFAQTPKSEAEQVTSLQQICKSYEPTLLKCVTKGPFDYKTVQTCIRKWYAVNTKVQKGRTIMDIVSSKLQPAKDIETKVTIDSLHKQQCLLKLIHAILANDYGRVKEMLPIVIDQRLSINFRHFSRRGKTPLLCAIQYNSLEIVQALLANGARAKSRVDYRADCAFESEDGRTTSILHIALARNIKNFEIFRSLAKTLSFPDFFERNSEGNTLTIEALKNGRSLEEIRYIIIDLSRYAAIADKNADGENLRKICKNRGRQDVDALIVESLCYLLNDSDSRNSRELVVHLLCSSLGAEYFQTGNKVKISDGDQLLFDSLSQKLNTLECTSQLLFQAVHAGDIETAKRYNVASFQDKSGQTALIKAIINERVDLVEWLLIERPELKYLPDNKNRYPLHFAFLLPDGLREKIVRLLTEDFPQHTPKSGGPNTESVVVIVRDETEMFDQDGLLPADYKKIRADLQAQQKQN